MTDRGVFHRSACWIATMRVAASGALIIALSRGRGNSVCSGKFDDYAHVLLLFSGGPPRGPRRSITDPLGSPRPA